MSTKKWGFDFFKKWPKVKYTAAVTLIGLTWIPVCITFTDTVASIGFIQGPSMQPAINPDTNLGRRDMVLLRKFGIFKPGALSNGDVVMLRSPLDPAVIVAKRIVASEGEEVRTRYPYPRPTVIVPRNHLWVEGDNFHSVDSNTYGPVSKGLVLNKISYIIWPFYRIGPIPPGGRECRTGRSIKIT